MRTRTRAWPCLPGPERPAQIQIQIRIERAHGAVVITVPGRTERRIVRGKAFAQPSAGKVREDAGAVRIDPVALGELVDIKIGDPLHRPAHLVGNGAQPILKTVVIAHAPYVRRYLIPALRDPVLRLCGYGAMVPDGGSEPGGPGPLGFAACAAWIRPAQTAFAPRSPVLKHM
jgi:hypothetical protein